MNKISPFNNFCRLGYRIYTAITAFVHDQHLLQGYREMYHKLQPTYPPDYPLPYYSTALLNSHVYSTSTISVLLDQAKQASPLEASQLRTPT